MSQVRFLKRVTLWQNSKQGSVPSVSFEEQLLVDIERLLNSRQGNVLIDKDMGLPDLQGQFQSHGIPDLEILTDQIRFQLTEFEPRLSKFSLFLDEENNDVSCYCWKLNGTSTTNQFTHNILATIKVFSNGQIVVEPTV
jgi:predicted component of type VI protein secretion system